MRTRWWLVALWGAWCAVGSATAVTLVAYGHWPWAIIPAALIVAGLVRPLAFYDPGASVTAARRIVLRAVRNVLLDMAGNLVTSEFRRTGTLAGRGWRVRLARRLANLSNRLDPDPWGDGIGWVKRR